MPSGPRSASAELASSVAARRPGTIRANAPSAHRIAAPVRRLSATIDATSAPAAIALSTRANTVGPFGGSSRAGHGATRRSPPHPGPEATRELERVVRCEAEVGSVRAQDGLRAVEARPEQRHCLVALRHLEPPPQGIAFGPGAMIAPSRA